MCEVVTAFGLHNFHRLKANQQAEAEMFFTILLQFTKHPSIVMATETMSVWGVAFKEEKDLKPVFINMEFFQKFYPLLLKECSDKMLRELGNPENESMSITFVTNR